MKSFRFTHKNLLLICAAAVFGAFFPGNAWAQG
jgi:hypothetical protein